MSDQKSYYECHITMEGNAGRIQPVVENAIGWKFSQIAGDIILGDDIKCYATKHYNSKIEANEIVENVLRASKCVEAYKIKIVRRKVELVIFDDRSSKIRV